MTHSGCHGSINQPQLVVGTVKPHRVPLFRLINRHLSTVNGWLNSLLHFAPPTFFHKLDLPLTPERWEGWEGNLESAAEPGFVSRHSKWEDERVWRNAAVQTALWFSGHAAHCDSLWLKHRGDHRRSSLCSSSFQLPAWVREEWGRGAIERKYCSYVGSICCNMSVFEKEKKS